MTKNEAYLKMGEGNKVTHKYFSDDEYIYMDNRGYIMAEDKCNFTEEFEERRNEDPWLDGWEIKK